MLEVKDLHVHYGAIHAIKGISFHVGEGEIVSLIGANGAGKTTTLQAMSGLKKISGGFVAFMGNDLAKIKPEKILRLGMAHVPEGRRIFSRMSVQENLEMSAYIVKSKEQVQEEFKHVLELFPRLGERLKQRAGTLSGGEQQMLAISRALMSRPKMILMDEPSMGLSPILVKEIFRIVAQCKKDGMTILLVEQNASIALSISDRAYVLETGRIALEGNSSELMGNVEVKKAYLGG
ncbi:MAG: ABC transporter ATP-binding protein [Clostridiales bacterium]|jgi:branched-chain amino acid transport system ATP-binding protein|nr:ABC transporter ATP-binding protein [Clostridiales bacterium]